MCVLAIFHLAPTTPYLRQLVPCLASPQYDTGQISDIVLMPEFLQRFANSCSDPTNPNSCSFTDVREGLIVALLSIGTLVGALIGAP